MDKSLEEGELSDDSDCYVPLERPENYSSFSNVIIKPQVHISDSELDEKSSSNSDSDSDSAIKQKRPKLKPRLIKRVTKSTNQKYNIWSNRIQEEVLVDTLNTCDVTKKDRSRDVESYDYPVRNNFESKEGTRDLRELLSKKNKDKCDVDNRTNNKRSRDDRKNKKLKLVGKKERDNDEKGAPRYLLNLVVNETNSDEEVARDLANKLFETKEDLLLRIVNTLGKNRSMKIFEDVQRIEGEGGMLIMNQSRRRTPGGVYIFLVKHDDNLTRKEIDCIFENEKQKSKEEIRQQKKDKYSKMKKSAYKKNIPELSSVGELCVEKMIKKAWVNDKGETEHEEVDNPPPTPETDYNDTLDDTKVIDEVSGRQSQEYDEDFLDLECANDMDIF